MEGSQLSTCISVTVILPHTLISFLFQAVCDTPSLSNGAVMITGNSIGSTATFVCDSGFMLDGDNVTTCTEAADGNSATFSPIPDCLG